MPAGGFGNLIALPLQKIPRRSDNSVFVDEHLIPFPDQWRYLAGIPRLEPFALERLVRSLERNGNVVGGRMSLADDDSGEDPWLLPPSRRSPEKPVAGPFPESVRVVRANLLFIEKKGLPEAMLDRMNRLAAFQNPEFYKAQAMRLPTYDKPRVIGCAEEFPQFFAFPRGLLDEVELLLSRHKITARVDDERSTGKPIDVAFAGTLRDKQPDAVKKLLKHDEGVLCAGTAFGKTVAAAFVIAARRTNTLVLVHRAQLLDQWRERLASFLDLPIDSIGQIRAGKNKTTGIIDVAIIQSVCIASTTAKRSSKCMTMWIRRYPCWRGCSRNVSEGTRLSDIQSTKRSERRRQECQNHRTPISCSGMADLCQCDGMSRMRNTIDSPWLRFEGSAACELDASSGG